MNEEIIIRIKNRWGSPHQKRSATEALKTLLKGWDTFYSLSHKNNRIDMEMELVENKLS